MPQFIEFLSVRGEEVGMGDLDANIGNLTKSLVVEGYSGVAQGRRDLFAADGGFV